MKKIWMLIVILMIVTGCQEKERKPKTGGGNALTTPGPTETENQIGLNDKLCNDLLKSSAVKTDHGELLEEFCSLGKRSKILELRTEEFVYKGGTTAKISEDSEPLANKQSDMKLYTSNIYDCDGDSYIKLQKMQQMTPEEFTKVADAGKVGFKYDKEMEYKVLSKGSNSVSFSYLNDKETAVSVSYEGTTKFYDIDSSTPNVKRYAIGTVLTNPKDSETIKSLNALVVVNEIFTSVKENDSLVKQVEVFTLSHQIYDNNGDHASTLKKAKQNLANEQQRGYVNASKARSYFK